MLDNDPRIYSVPKIQLHVDILAIQQVGTKYTITLL